MAHGTSGMTNIVRTSGFDYLRLVLSMSVVVSHTILSSYGLEAQAAASASPFGMVNRLVLPMFFALSGFLVAGSLFRCKTLVSFAGLRIIRLIPALSFEVALSALLLGPIFTSLSLPTYFQDPDFAVYFLNIIGDIHYTLPGVFLDNPFPNVVNVQLWTIPWELNCYIALGLIALVGLARHRKAMLVFLIALQILLFCYAGFKIHSGVASSNGSSGPILLTSFFAGFVIFLYKDDLPWSSRVFALSVIVSLVIEALPFGNFAIAIPSAYMTVFLGRCNPRKVFPITFGDYSYGIYLYGLPIQQAIASLGPSFQHWYVSLLLGLPLAFLVAALSWHLIERPVLGRRDVVDRVEAAWMRLKSSGLLRPRMRLLKIPPEGQG